MARVLSGIQPSGDVHLGNYIGALKHWVAAQDVDDCFYFIPDLHAITVPQDPAVLRRATLDGAATLMAVGIDPDRSTLWVQSHVHEHAELTWVLSNFTSFGDLGRMTQFKDKSSKQQLIGAGLFMYPVLQAADILLYRAHRVPVGEDQRQHLELTRDIAQRFNQRYGDTFVVPEAAIPPVGARILDLQKPEDKMSKSTDSPTGTIRVILDSPDEIRKKVMSAVTDSGREIVAVEEKPAITNLLTIFSVVSGRSVPELETAYAGKGYGEFKADLAEALVEFLRPVQVRYRELMSDTDEIARLLEIGAAKAQKIAAEVLNEVYDRVGLLPRGG
jgi:tryptophanyl-tRNA synthetase